MPRESKKEHGIRRAVAALTAERDALKDRDQRWVDEVAHYRNLAIRLGAQPEHMLSQHDRTLCEHGLPEGNREIADERAVTVDLWRITEALEAERDELRQALSRAHAVFGAESDRLGKRWRAMEAVCAVAKNFPHLCDSPRGDPCRLCDALVQLNLDRCATKREGADHP